MVSWIDMIRGLQIVLLTLVLSILAAACSSTDQSEPWWIQVLVTNDHVLDATFSDDGRRVTVAFLRDGEADPHLGIVGMDDETRAVKDLGVMTWTKSVSTAGYGIDNVDLAARPGTSQVWAYLGGDLVRFDGGSPAGATITDAAGTVHCCAPGSIAFLDGDTLAYGNDQGVWIYPLSGDALGAPTALPVSPAPLDAPSLVGVDGQLWTNLGFFSKDGARLPSSEDQGVSAPLLGSKGGAGWSNPSNNQGICITERHPDGGARTLSGESVKVDGACDNLDLPLPQGVFGFRRGELAPSGEAVALTAGGALVVASADEPASSSSDLEGTWCAVTGSSFAVKDGVITDLDGSAAYLDSLFGEVLLEGGGTVRTVNLQDPDPGIAENIVLSKYDYFMKRSGNTLVVHGPTTRDQAKHMAAGYRPRSGLYLKGGDAQCQTLAP